MSTIKKLLKKYEEIIRYLIVGVLTTIVSWGAYYICIVTVLDAKVAWMNAVANTISWAAGVLFGYVANRKYVFMSKEPNILKEFLQFAGSRVSTWLLDVVVMYVAVNVCEMNEMIAKVFISSVLVMIANYLISKLFVFKKEENKPVS